MTPSGNQQPSGVAMITSVFAPSIGGAQRVVVETGRLLRARGVQVLVVTRHHVGLARYEEVQGIPTYRVGRGDAGKAVAALSFILGALWLLWRLRGRYDVLHCHQMISPMTIGLVARAFTGRPLVVMPHRSGPIGDIGVLTRRRPITGRLRIATARRWAAAFVCISPAIRAELRQHGVPDARLWEIANGVDVARFRPASPAERLALRGALGLPAGHLAVFTGRLAAEKGLDVLLEAWPAVAAHVPDAHLTLVGAGEEQAALEAQARRLGVADHVTFTGGSADVAPFLRAADLFVLPSYAEGLPVALLEAQACGLPCVGTAIDGTAQVVRDGVTGRLVPPGVAGALAAALVEGFTSAEAEGWGERGRATIVRHYALDGVVAQYLAMYQAISPAFAERAAPVAAARREA
jgi:glycosyltransferase involved in cell wall biosynthesis